MMWQEIVPFFAIAIVMAVFSPIYFLRRKIWRMADRDLKLVDPAGWHDREAFNIYVRLIARLAWSALFLFGFIRSLARSEGFSGIPFYFIPGIIFFGSWAIFGFRRGRKELITFQ